MNILDGKKIAGEVLEDVSARAAALKKIGVVPSLATVLVGEDPASHVYVGQKIKRCEAAGMRSLHRPLPKDVREDDLLSVIDALNHDRAVHAILVQLPLPKHLDMEVVVRAIDPAKDADGLHPLNQGLIGRLKNWDEIAASGVPLPCTPAGVIALLMRSKVPIAGTSAVVVGRSTLVGKPMAQLLLSLDATVTIAHSKTADLASVCRQADILVAAMGRPGSINKDAVKPGAAVVDVGISRTSAGIVGDVDFASVSGVAGWLSPVPGGVGPMTVAMLLQNTVRLASL